VGARWPAPPSGECPFIGAAGTKRGSGGWEIAYRFADRPNVTGLGVGDITGIAKKDLHLWVRTASWGSRGRAHDLTVGFPNNSITKG
jgi:hypothetical protein